MKIVYRANDAIEAQLMKNMLKQVDIDAFIHGDILQGGIGELQAFGLVQVLVHEEDYYQAKQVIDDWNNANILET